MKSDKVLITGVTGQDGSLLAKLLVEQGKKVFGTYRKTSSNYFSKLAEIGILDSIQLVEYQIGQTIELIELLRSNKFESVYHLAGESMTADSLLHPHQTININTQGVIDLLEAVNRFSRDTKIFIAGSSEIFDNKNQNSNSKIVTEDDPKKPRNPYGVSILANMNLANIYREQFGLTISFGIMFNHESPLRGEQFITRKITKGLAELKYKNGQVLLVGSFDSKRDWGAANDFVIGMQTMTDLSLNDSYILATGKLNSVREILTICSKELGYSPVFVDTGVNESLVDGVSGQTLAKINSKFFRKFDDRYIAGDATKFKNISGWKNTIEFESIISDMCRYDAEKARHQ